MFVDEALEVVVNLLFQRSRAGVTKHADGNLAIVVVPPLDIHEDFDVTGFAVARNDARNLQVRRRLARGVRGDLRNRSDSQSFA